MAVREWGSVDVVGLIRDVLDLDLDPRSARRLERGQGRTFLCRIGDEDVVVKWGLDPDLTEKIPYVASQIGELRRRDCVAPAILGHGPLPGRGYAWVQQHLVGAPATVLDAALLSDLVGLTDRLADAPPGAHRSNFAQWVPAVVFGDPRAGGRPPGPPVRRWRRSAAGYAPGSASRRLRARGTTMCTRT